MTDFYSQNRCVIVYALRDLMGHCYVHFAFLFTLRNISSDYQFHSKSGIDERQSIMQGRPYGGVAVMWHDSMSKHIYGLLSVTVGGFVLLKCL